MHKYYPEKSISKEEGDRIKKLPNWSELIRDELSERIAYRNSETGEILIYNWGDGNYRFIELEEMTQEQKRIKVAEEWLNSILED